MLHNTKEMNSESMKEMKIVSFNCEGLSYVKAELLSALEADILCLQETHKDMTPPAIPGMNLIVHHPSPVHGSAIYIKNIANIDRSHDDTTHGVEILRVETTQMTIVSVYKPPPIPFYWPPSAKLDTNQTTRPTLQQPQHHLGLR